MEKGVGGSLGGGGGGGSDHRLINRSGFTEKLFKKQPHEERKIRGSAVRVC